MSPSLKAELLRSTLPLSFTLTLPSLTAELRKSTSPELVKRRSPDLTIEHLPSISSAPIALVEGLAFVFSAFTDVFALEPVLFATADFFAFLGEEF